MTMKRRRRLHLRSWYVGLEWDDAFMEGNSFGMAVGQPTFDTDGDGAGYAWEFFYKFQVTDNITVTPVSTSASPSFFGDAL